ncbi:MAG: patatin-like phospholipase family protein [Bacteroidota bacterium]
MADQLNKQIRILSIDGGGVRGIIPARILQEIETRTSKRIHELFDLIVGNSTGGILALGLVTPDEKGQAKFTAQDLVSFYQQNCPKIFSHSLWRKVSTGWGLWNPKYSRDNLDKILKEVLGNVKLSQTLKPAMITSYSLDQSLPHLWTTRRAKEAPNHNYYLRDIAGATSAAPTYFSPKVIQTSDGRTLHEIDGGIWANDPEVTVVEELKAMGVSNLSTDVLMVALGTGKVALNKSAKDLKNAGIIGWLVNANLIDIMMSADSEWSESVATALFPQNYRLKVPIAPSLSAMDNSSQKNMNGLLKAAEACLKTQEEMIDKICKALTSIP